MPLVEGTVYQLVKTDIQLTTGEIEYKVCFDHGWGGRDGVPNSKLNIEKGGKYDITFTFDTNGDKSTASAVLKEEIDILPTVQMKGGWDGWAASVDFTLAADQKTASATKTIAKGDYEFKMVISEGWRGNGASVTRETNTVANFSSNGDNMKLVADASGEYTFTWTFETNTLAITFPAPTDEPDVLPVVALAGDFNEWNTTANVLVAADDQKNASIKIALDASYFEFKVVVGGSWYSKANDGPYGLHREWTSADGLTTGNDEPNMKLTADVAGDYIFTWTYESKEVAITFPASIPSGISNTADEANAVKFIENGQIYIRRNGVVYSILGK